MAVQGLYALQNGFMGAQRSLLFYGEYAEARTQIPITCYVVRTSDAVIVFDTGVAPRAVPGLMRNDSFARFTDEDLLVHRLDGLGLEPSNVDLVVISHLHYDHAGGAALHWVRKLKTLARLAGARICPSHDSVFSQTVKQAPEAYR